MCGDNLSFNIKYYWQIIEPELFVFSITEKERIAFFDEILLMLFNMKIINNTFASMMLEFDSKYFEELNELLYVPFDFIILGNNGSDKVIETKYLINKKEYDWYSYRYRRQGVSEKLMYDPLDNMKINSYLFSNFIASISYDFVFDQSCNNYFYEVLDAKDWFKE